ncbi:coiled-coil domain-containing protein 187 isoform X1 [Phyllopteryx taeniolatus]|uniref:coiled-coil domain-containing protein 187 isoform X1 n=1 Tax=Phyllopteryx taeniolatus TaxID=161469 RepID=UPI002AD29288|nr:coiled-coil domain-containing protein 187 isoform X1 [Phyllopteryx taeniolatus]
MAELQIDQSNLPRVQEVCQSFAVLEDGVLAHNLQEQEIEQYYTTNIQKSQLVQNDIRVAKQLQDEEEAQRALQRALLRQESRQLEEQDFEYARVIQEEIRRRAEEAWRREQDDEEMAKQMQEEEEQRMRRARAEEEHREGSSSGSAPPSPNQHALSRQRPGEAQYSPTTARGQYSNTPNPPDYSRPPPPYCPGRVAAHQTATSWSSEGHTHSRGQLRRELEESLRAHSDFFEQRRNIRNNTAPLHRRLSLRLPRERDYRSLSTPSGIREGRDGRGLYDDNGDREKRRARDWELEMNHQLQNTTWGNRHGSAEAREGRCSRSESVRIHDRPRHGSRDSSGTWSSRDNADKHVRFAAGTRSSDRRPDTSMQVWEMLGHVLRERGVPVTLGGRGAPLKIGPQKQDSQPLRRSEVSYCDTQPHQTHFQRAASTRHSFHGDIRERRLPRRDNREPDHRGSEDGHPDNVMHDGELSQISGRGSRRWGRPDHNLDSGSAASEDTVVRTGGRHWHETIEERFSSEGEAEREPERRPQRSLSSSWVRWRHMAAGASLPSKKRQTSLDLGDLQQVLHDEELACKLQEQETKFLTRTSQPRPRSHYPEGDFRLAQVAQDEEIAHYMQKQEIKSNRISRELEGPASWREHRAIVSHHDQRTTREKQVQRQRLDSEGLPSPTEDCSPENQPPSPVSTLTQSQQLQNVAEELDPTFQAKRQGADILRMGQTGTACQSLPEEPTFIPPTKRQKDKARRTNPKEKKENCKQQ